VTTTDEILALAASAVGTSSASAASTGTDAAAPGVGRANDRSTEVTEADFAAFGEAAARGADSAVVRALLAVRPAGVPLGDPAWNAWLTAAAAAADATWTPENKGAAEPTHPAGLAVFAAGNALADPSRDLPAGVTVPAAAAAGISAAALIESGLANWGGWSSGTVAAAIGASVTAGLLLGLTRPQLRAAVGICATQAAGLAAAEGTPAFALQVGKAAFNAVEAALLARSGFTAPGEPLDGRRGLFALFG
jgi:hypothetical protein